MPSHRVLKWFTTLQHDVLVLNGAQFDDNLLEDMSVADQEGATVTRILLEMWIHPSSVDNPVAFDWGIVFVNIDAVTAGAFPDADDEDERADWLGRGRLVAITSVANDGAGLVHSTYDLRAQRRFRTETDKLMLIGDDTGGNLRLSFMSRVLMRMP